MRAQRPAWHSRIPLFMRALQAILLLTAGQPPLAFVFKPLWFNWSTSSPALPYTCTVRQVKKSRRVGKSRVLLWFTWFCPLDLLFELPVGLLVACQHSKPKKMSLKVAFFWLLTFFLRIYLQRRAFYAESHWPIEKKSYGWRAEQIFLFLKLNE